MKIHGSLFSRILSRIIVVGASMVIIGFFSVIGLFSLAIAAVIGILTIGLRN